MKKAGILYVAIFCLLVIVSCSNQPKESEKDIEHENEGTLEYYEFSHEQQSFQVVYLLEEISEFAKLAQKDEDVHVEELYDELVLKPIETTLGYKDSLGESSFFSYDTDLEKLESNAVELGKEIEDIQSLVKESLLLSAKKLPSSDIKVFIMPMNPDDYFGINYMEGVSGVAATNGEFIIIQIDPSYQKETLQYALAHEYNHTVVLKNQDGIKEDIMELVILEGKADVFAEEVFPHVEVPWIEPLLDDELKMVTEEIINYPYEYDTYVNLQQGTRDYPVWSNYRLGYAIMKSYLEGNEHIPSSEWTHHKKEDIINESDYSHLNNH